MNVTF